MDGGTIFGVIGALFTLGLCLGLILWCSTKSRRQEMNGIKQLVEHMPEAVTRSDVIELLRNCRLERNGIWHGRLRKIAGKTVEYWTLTDKPQVLFVTFDENDYLIKWSIKSKEN